MKWLLWYFGDESTAICIQNGKIDQRPTFHRVEVYKPLLRSIPFGEIITSPYDSYAPLITTVHSRFNIKFDILRALVQFSARLLVKADRQRRVHQGFHKTWKRWESSLLAHGSLCTISQRGSTVKLDFRDCFDCHVAGRRCWNFFWNAVLIVAPAIHSVTQDSAPKYPSDLRYKRPWC